jgi:sensor histidine kinase regulating citrate/malate metabolism
MKIIHNLKTSDKITFLFTIFNLISLIFLLISINIIYFFAWYTDQKKESMYDMNMNYSMYISEKTDTNLEAFKKYILQKDTLIIPND